MSDSTPRLGLPDLPDTPELYADTVADAFARIDAFTDLCLKGQFVNTPPASPSDGDAYLIGGSPTGDWSSYPYKLAVCRDGAWTKLAPFDGLRAFVPGSKAFLVYCAGTWTDWNALTSAAESSVASAATCDIGAVGSLFLAVTGTTTITSFGTATNTLRYLRFAGVLTLTHNATSLILPGGASIVTAAGDCALLTSDGSGNWRCRHYQRASGLPVSLLNPVITGTLTAAAVTASGNVTISNLTAGRFPLVGASGLLSDSALFQYNAGNKAVQLTGAGSDTIVGAPNIQWNAGSGSTVALQLNASSGLDTWVFNSSWSVATRVAVDGSFLVGTRTSSGWHGDAQLEAKAVGTRCGMSAYQAGSSGSAIIARVDSTASNLMYFNFNGAADVGTVTTNGTATSYNTTSDARLKTVLPQQADYRAAIRALWVGDFTWKQNGTPGFGVLAQQAWEVMPNHQGVARPVDEAGQWQASAEPFAHLALWGVKDLYAMIEVLAVRVAALEAVHDVA